MSTIYYDYLNTPIGQLLLGSTDQGLCLVGLDTGKPLEERLEEARHWARQKVHPDAALYQGNSPILAEAAGQLASYFAGNRQTFDLPLDLFGTPFQQQVWRELALIPYGEVRSYKQVAEAIGSPKAVRAVGGANNRNPIPVIIPCHRVIGAGGAMVGYAGGLAAKHSLLALEGYQLPLAWTETAAAGERQ